MAGAALSIRDGNPESITGRLGQTDATLRDCEELLYTIFDALDGPIPRAAQNEAPIGPGVSSQLMSLNSRSIRIRDLLNDLVNKIR